MRRPARPRRGRPEPPPPAAGDEVDLCAVLLPGCSLSVAGLHHLSLLSSVREVLQQELHQVVGSAQGHRQVQAETLLNHADELPTEAV